MSSEPGRRAVIRQVRLATEPLSVDRLLGEVSEPSVGGVGLFVGVVRDHDDADGRDGDAEVVSLDYTAHPSAEAALLSCVTEVAGRHDVVAVAVEHRIGHLEVGDLAVVVAVGAVHRQAALAATAELIDEVKRQVPIWKEQHYVSGQADWVGLP